MIQSIGVLFFLNNVDSIYSNKLMYPFYLVYLVSFE